MGDDDRPLFEGKCSSARSAGVRFSGIWLSILAGEPCFRGLRLPVRKIGEMLRAHGAAAEKEIALDYPDLSKEDLAFALKYVIVHPRPRTEALDP